MKHDVVPENVATCMVSIDQLSPYNRNPRKNDHALERMCASIREFGFKIPILARSNGEIVDGHLRLKAAVELGLDRVPVIFCDEWTAPQVKAFRLMVNRSVGWAEWDDDLLKLELEDLRTVGFDIANTGFDERELQALLLGTVRGEIDPDAIIERKEESISRVGDLWILGDHRLLCGDATHREEVERLLQGRCPLLMVTDPPYGVEYRPEWRNEAARTGSIAFAARREGRVANDDRIDWSEAYALFPGNIAYIWHASLFGSTVQQSIERSGFELRSQIIWAKSRFAISRGHYHWQHECCFYAVRKGASGNWCGDHSQTTLWTIASSSSDEDPNDHGTQKPVELMRRAILNHTQVGDRVYDPFVGTGTTLIAAETTGRIADAMDIDPCWIDVAVRRWQEFTGRTATLDNDGRPFDEVARERRS
jgi:DNA modification methylase